MSSNRFLCEKVHVNDEEVDADNAYNGPVFDELAEEVQVSWRASSLDWSLSRKPHPKSSGTYK